MAELRPCEICGSPAEIEMETDETCCIGRFYCKNGHGKKVLTVVTMTEEETLEMGTALWNQRQETEKRRKEGKAAYGEIVAGYKIPYAGSKTENEEKEGNDGQAGRGNRTLQ